MYYQIYHLFELQIDRHALKVNMNMNLKPKTHLNDTSKFSPYCKENLCPLQKLVG
jgi:hypothetical protein